MPDRPHEDGTVKKILFVSNEAARTGAPAILLGLMKWLKDHSSIQTSCVLMRDGALRQEFEQLGPTHTWIPTDLNQPQRIHKRLAGVILKNGNSDPGVWLNAMLEKEQPDIIYLSTLVLGKYLQSTTKKPWQRIVTHVHELQPSLKQLSNDACIHTQLQLSDAVISCAQCVTENLQTNYGLSTNKTYIIPEYIDISETSLQEANNHRSGKTHDVPSTLPSKERELLATLHQAATKGIPIFGVGGNPIHRKGFDLFPQFIQECKHLFQATPFLAVWIGCGEGSGPEASLNWDLTHMGLKDEVLLIPSVSMPAFRWILSQFKVLTLLSREDPFPLVSLEAGLLGIPTVCFEGSGAIPEFAAQGQCVSVKYLDLAAFAAAVHQLCLNPGEARLIGERCRAKILQNLTLEKVAPQVAEVLLGEAWREGDSPH